MKKTLHLTKQDMAQQFRNTFLLLATLKPGSEKMILPGTGVTMIAHNSRLPFKVEKVVKSQKLQITPLSYEIFDIENGIGIINHQKVKTDPKTRKPLASVIINFTKEGFWSDIEGNRYLVGEAKVFKKGR